MIEMTGQIIQEYRLKKLEGQLIDLTPFSPEDSEAIVAIRNQDYVRWCFNQTRIYDVAGQIKWYEGYLDTNNDIFWCIRKKDDTIAGMIRIYDIDDKKEICTQGTIALDEKYKDEAPYAIEALVMTLDFAFDVLGVKSVLHGIRIGNKSMNNLSRKLGAVSDGIELFKDVEYNRWILHDCDYRMHREQFQQIVGYWVNRGMVS